MYWISVSALGALWYFFYKGKKKASPDGKETIVTKAFAWTKKAGKTGGIKEDRQAKTLKNTTDPLERHTLYTQAIDAAYKKRTADKKMRSLVIKSGTSYVREFPELKASVFKEFGENPKIVTVFKQLAIVFEEDEAFDRAMDICRTAMVHELEDGTKTGYEGRLERLMKKKERSA